MSVLARLFVIQFFAWTGMFGLWIYTTPLVAARFGGGDFEAPGVLRLVGVAFALYATVAAIINFAQARLVATLGQRTAYAGSLLIGALGIAGVAYASTPAMLLAAFALVGIGWSAVSTTPYALASAAFPGRETHAANLLAFSIVIPQAVAALVLVPLARSWLGRDPATPMLGGAGAMAIAALAAMLLVAPANAQQAAGNGAIIQQPFGQPLPPPPPELTAEQREARDREHHRMASWLYRGLVATDASVEQPVEIDTPVTGYGNEALWERPKAQRH